MLNFFLEFYFPSFVVSVSVSLPEFKIPLRVYFNLFLRSDSEPERPRIKRSYHCLLIIRTPEKE